MIGKRERKIRTRLSSPTFPGCGQDGNTELLRGSEGTEVSPPGKVEPRAAPRSCGRLGVWENWPLGRLVAQTAGEHQSVAL